MPADCGENTALLFRLRGTDEDYGTDKLGAWAYYAGKTLIKAGWRVRDMQAIYPTPKLPPLWQLGLKIALAIVRKKVAPALDAVEDVKQYRDLATTWAPAVQRQLEEAARRCRQRRILLAGYSYGNIIMRYVLPRLEPDVRKQIASVDLVSDPTADGRVDSTLRHPSNLADARLTDAGIDTVGARTAWTFATVGLKSFRQTPYPKDVASRVYQYCAEGDLVCDFRFSGNPLADIFSQGAIHKSYGFSAIGVFAARRVGSPPQPSPPPCPGGRLGVVFVIDDSGSNVEVPTDPTLLRAAAAKVALEYLPAGSLVAALRFASGSATIFGPTNLTAENRLDLAEAIRRSLQSSGSTNYESAFLTAASLLDQMTATGRRIVIFISDGMPTSPYSADQQIAQRGVPIHTIGYGTASKEELQGIASRSGGRFYEIQDIAQAQNAFAQIVNPLVCNNPIVSGTSTITPSVALSRSFSVTGTIPGFTALASWTVGVPTVFLRRPDGSALSGPSTRRPNESIQRPSPNAIRFDVAAPQPGQWTLVARTRDPRGVLLSYDVWTTPRPAVDVVRPAAIPGGCPTAVTLAELVIRGCWRRVGDGTFRVRGGVRANGVVLLGRSFVFDPKKEEFRSTGPATLRMGNLVVGRSRVRWTRSMVEDKAVRFRSTGVIKGIPMVGDARLGFAIARGEPTTTLVANVLVPIGPHRVTGQIPLSAGEAHGLRIDGVNVYVAGNTPVDKGKRVLLLGLTLYYQKADDRWVGQAELALPAGAVRALPRVPTLGFLVRGKLTPFAGETGFAPSRELAQGVAVETAKVSLTAKPTILKGSASVAFGPTIAGQRMFALHGPAAWRSSTGWTIDGSAKVLDKGTLTGRAALSPDTGAVQLTGKLDLSAHGFATRGDLSGFVVGGRLNAYAKGTVTLIGAPEVAGETLLSNAGYAACAKFSFFRGGFGYRWDGSETYLREHLIAGSCDVGPWVASTATSTVRAGTPFVVFNAGGQAGPPEIVVRGPGGRLYDSRIGPFVDRGDVFVWHDPSGNQTYLAVPRPPAGVWTVEQAPDSPTPLAFVRRADGLPSPLIRVRARSKQGKVVLRYTIARLPAGGRVTFYEGSTKRGFTRPLVGNVRRSGRSTVTPEGVGPSRRYLWALVTNGELPRLQGIFGRFRAEPAPRPQAPAVRARRADRVVVARWSGPGASSWHVTILSSDGRKVFFRYPSRQRRLAYSVDPRYRVTVIVRAVDRYGREGAAGRRTLAGARSSPGAGG